jgi:3-hydroxypropanoate dehydrogenase
VTDTSDLIQLPSDVRAALFDDARTPKKFTTEPVTIEQLVAVRDLVQWGPTMTNSQPLRVVLARTDEARARVLAHLLPYNQERAGNAPVLAVFCADHAFERHIERIFPGAPMVAAMYGDATFRDRVADSQAWMQAGYWVIGVRAAGLDILPMMGFDANGMDTALAPQQESLFPGSQLRSIMVAAIGHAAPDAYPPRPPRLERHEVLAEL